MLGGSGQTARHAGAVPRHPGGRKSGTGRIAEHGREDEREDWVRGGRVDWNGDGREVSYTDDQGDRRRDVPREHHRGGRGDVGGDRRGGGVQSEISSRSVQSEVSSRSVQSEVSSRRSVAEAPALTVESICQCRDCRAWRRHCSAEARRGMGAPEAAEILRPRPPPNHTQPCRCIECLEGIYVQHQRLIWRKLGLTGAVDRQTSGVASTASVPQRDPRPQQDAIPAVVHSPPAENVHHSTGREENDAYEPIYAVPVDVKKRVMDADGKVQAGEDTETRDVRRSFLRRSESLPNEAEEVAVEEDDQQGTKKRKGGVVKSSKKRLSKLWRKMSFSKDREEQDVAVEESKAKSPERRSSLAVGPLEDHSPPIQPMNRSYSMNSVFLPNPPVAASAGVVHSPPVPSGGAVLHGQSLASFASQRTGQRPSQRRPPLSRLRGSDSSADRYSSGASSSTMSSSSVATVDTLTPFEYLGIPNRRSGRGSSLGETIPSVPRDVASGNPLVFSAAPGVSETSGHAGIPRLAGVTENPRSASAVEVTGGARRRPPLERSHTEPEAEEHEPGFHSVDDLHRSVSLEKFNYEFHSENSTFVPVFPGAFKQTGFRLVRETVPGEQRLPEPAPRSRASLTEGSVQVSTQRPLNGSGQRPRDTSVQAPVQNAAQGSVQEVFEEVVQERSDRSDQGTAYPSGSVDVAVDVHSIDAELHSAHLNGSVIQNGGMDSAPDSRRSAAATEESRWSSDAGQISASQPAALVAGPSDGTEQCWTVSGTAAVPGRAVGSAGGPTLGQEVELTGPGWEDRDARRERIRQHWHQYLEQNVASPRPHSGSQDSGSHSSHSSTRSRRSKRSEHSGGHSRQNGRQDSGPTITGR